MDPKEVYRAYKTEAAIAAEALKEDVVKATETFALETARATNEYITAMDEAVKHFRQAAK